MFERERQLHELDALQWFGALALESVLCVLDPDMSSLSLINYKGLQRVTRQSFAIANGFTVTTLARSSSQ